MLVEYTMNTKDEEIGVSALELRRRVGARKLNEAIANGLNEDTLRAMRLINSNEMKEQGHEQFTLKMTGVTQKITVARAEQQLNIEANLRVLDRDLTRASRLSKSKIDTLNDLEKRITMMRHQLTEVKPTTVDDDIYKALGANNKAKADRLFQLCTRCNRKILVILFPTHNEACEKLGGNLDGAYDTKEAVYDVNQNVEISLTTFCPQPPRNCRVVSKGSSFIEWEWDQPVSDGGLPIIDYEISYTAKMKEFDKKTGKYRHWYVECPGIKTAIWCMQTPVLNNGYKMICLRSETEYHNFKIRAINLRGPSPWHPMLEFIDNPLSRIPSTSVFTEEPDAPSPALSVKCENITSSCMYLSWTPPYYDGGLDIKSYVVHYTPVERFVSSTKKLLVERHLSFDTGSSECHCVIRNIQADTKIIKINVRAVNSGGLTGEGGKLPYDPQTKMNCRCTQIERKILEAEAMDTDFVDTDFYTGIFQRLQRKDFLKMLMNELKVTPPDPIELEEINEWKFIKSKAASLQQEIDDEIARKLAAEEAEDESFAPPLEEFTFSHKHRRAHFRSKIAKQERIGKELIQERLLIDANRGRMTSAMKVNQNRIMDLKLEKDRIINFKGDIVTSSVLSGATMQYQKDDIMTKLQAEMDVNVKELGLTKYKVIQGENRKAQIKIEINKCANTLKDRQAGFLMFSQAHEKAMKAMERMQANQNSETIMKNSFVLWIEYIQARNSMRDKVTKLFLDLIYRFKKSAFEKWHLGEFQSSSVEKDKFPSLGSLLLKQAQEKRLELQGLLREAIAGTTMIANSMAIVDLSKENRDKLTRSVHFKLQEEGMNHVKLASDEGMYFLYEADGYTREGNFALASSMYEAQLLLLQARPILNIKQLSITHGKMGKMYLKSLKFDRAMVEFDRQLSLAKEISDKPEQADAYLGMGHGYFARANYDEAIRYWDKAQNSHHALGNVKKYCEAMKGLKECYKRLGKMETVKLFHDKIDHFDGEGGRKIKLIDDKITDMKARLSTNAAGIEHMVHMERSTFNALGMRKFIHEKTAELKVQEALVRGQQKKATKIEEVLIAIQKELDEAFLTDEFEMWSNLVQDTPQLVEVEELKTRLDQRRRQEIIQFQVEKDLENKLLVLVKNLEDSIHDADERLELETGALMTHVKHDKSFRCIEFCAYNASGNEVTGTASGGFEAFLCAEGMNIHVIDYHSGELINIMSGDDKRRLGDKIGHVGIVTCLLHDGTLLFSGSTDETIICWNGYTFEKGLVLYGHEGSIVSLAVYGPMLASGSADSTIRLWDKYVGTQLRVVHGHSKSVLSMEIGSDWLLTGSADEEVRLWSINQTNKHALSVECTKRLIGHEVAVTCVRYGKMEVLTGDVLGRIFIWWMETGLIMRKCQVHQGPVKCMQFDAVHIVSGGVDCNICIVDIATGEPLQSLRGHTGHILAVAFDTERIISASGDNTLRYWQWGKKSGPSDKCHVLNTGENLAMIAKLYSITVQDVMKWNGITDMRQCFAGMKLIVRKGDPDKPTAAEAAKNERERRIKDGLSMGTKTGIKAQNIDSGAVVVYDRVSRLALDKDFHSMNNRLFKKERHEVKLFPVKDDGNAASSMNARLKPGRSTNINISMLKSRYFIAAENEEEWGLIADTLAIAMLKLYIEFDCYEIVLELKRTMRDTTSVIGRMQSHINQIETPGMRLARLESLSHTKVKRFLMPEEKKRLRKEARKVEKKLEKEKLKIEINSMKLEDTKSDDHLIIFNNNNNDSDDGDMIGKTNLHDIVEGLYESDEIIFNEHDPGDFEIINDDIIIDDKINMKKKKFPEIEQTKPKINSNTEAIKIIDKLPSIGKK